MSFTCVLHGWYSQDAPCPACVTTVTTSGDLPIKINLPESESLPSPSVNLRQLFYNNSDCYADTGKVHEGNYTEGDVIPAISIDKFIEIVTPLLQSPSLPASGGEGLREMYGDLFRSLSRISNKHPEVLEQCDIDRLFAAKQFNRENSDSSQPKIVQS